MPEFGSAKEAFEAMKDVDSSRIAGINGTIQFDLSGEGGGVWALVLSDGSLEVVEGGVDDPTTTINMSAEDYVKMTSGELNAMAAFMQGKIKMQGDMGLAMKLQSLIS